MDVIGLGVSSCKLRDFAMLHVVIEMSAEGMYHHIPT